MQRLEATMNKYMGLAALVVVTLAAAPTSRADTLLIERREAAASNPHPARGDVMNKVEARFGPPLHRVGPVGDPPITRWVYESFTVYFEHSHVITTVVNKAHADEKGPRPTS
jgi:hypothetical protein